MSVQYGCGGIFTTLHYKYGDVNKFVDVSYSSIYGSSSFFEWNEGFGSFHSFLNSSYEFIPKSEYLQFHFKKPFILHSLRIMIIKGNRFQKSWKLESKYKESKFEEVYQSDELLCKVLTQNTRGDCNETTQNYFSIADNKIKTTDTLKISSIGQDTFDTYSLVIGGIEFYGPFISYFTKKKSNNHFLSIDFFIIFIL